MTAAGNYGENGPGSVVDPSTSKNGICVGATGNYGVGNFSTSATANYVKELAIFSSEGPTKDGRLKPDLLAP